MHSRQLDDDNDEITLRHALEADAFLHSGDADFFMEIDQALLLDPAAKKPARKTRRSKRDRTYREEDLY